MTSDDKQDQSNGKKKTQEVLGEGRRENGLLVTLDVAGNEMQSDEPRDAGGSGRGPSPYDLLSAALASCTIMTLHMYARHKNWPLEAVHTRVRHGKIHAKDCEKCETKKGKVDRFDRTITLTGPLDEEQRQRLLEIADRCPVHRTLHEEVEIRTELAN